MRKQRLLSWGSKSGTLGEVRKALANGNDRRYNIEEIRNMLANGADVNGIKESTGTTILMEAVKRKRGDLVTKLVSLLLEQPDIQVNAKNKDNWTALHFVVFCKGIPKEDGGRKKHHPETQESFSRK